MYGLVYDNSGYDSSLIRWYNILIDKSYEQLDAIDVSKMIRQDILIEVARKKIVDLFMDDPFCGESYDGGLLEVIVSQEIVSKLNREHLHKLQAFLKSFKVECFSEWLDEETKTQYLNNLDILKKVATLPTR